MSEHSVGPSPVSALAYVGNSEKKCVLQLLVEPGEMVTAKELTARFSSVQTPDEAVRYKSLNNLPQAITNSHCKTGVFEAADELRFSTWWARKAEEDSELADSVAGHMLALSCENELGLEELWGKVSKPQGQLNSPHIRTLLFGRLSSLAVGDSLSLGELGTDTGLARGVVHKQITKLYERGFVDYSAINPSSQDVSFELVGGAAPEHSAQTRRGPRVRNQQHYAGSLTLRSEVGLILAEAQVAQTEEVTYDFLMERLARSDVKLDTLQGVVGVMLREGILSRRHRSPHQGDVFSDIQITAPQKEIIERCNRIVSGLKAGDDGVLQEGLRHGAAIMGNRDMVTHLLRKGYERSPFTPPLN